MQRNLNCFSLYTISFIPPNSCEQETPTNRDFVAAGAGSLSGNGFQVNYHSESSQGGECLWKVAILGNGIHKVISYPCDGKPHSIINLNRTLLVGNEFFSDTIGELVQLTKDGCLREVFVEEAGKFSSTVSAMDKDGCEKIHIKIEILKEQQERWNEWYKQKQKEAEQYLQQLQSNLAALQQQLFGGIFGGGFFG